MRGRAGTDAFVAAHHQGARARSGVGYQQQDRSQLNPLALMSEHLGVIPPMIAKCGVKARRAYRRLSPIPRHQ